MIEIDLPNARFDVRLDELDHRQPLGPANPDNSEYLALAAEFCPYIRPAIEARTLFQSTYALAELCELSTGARAAEGLLYVAIVHTEWFRFRRSRCDVKMRQLICDTIVIAGDDDLDWQQLAGVVMWPQWILKHLYSSAGIMFANFWRGYRSTAADGRQIPPPPRTILAIRSAIPPRDSRFVADDATLAADISDSCDDGQNVHLPIAPIAVTQSLSAGAVKELGYFDKARSWGRGQWPESVWQRLAAAHDPG